MACEAVDLVLMEPISPTRRQTLTTIVRVFTVASIVGLLAWTVGNVADTNEPDTAVNGWIFGVSFFVFGVCCIASLICLMALWGDMTRAAKTRSEKAGWLVFLGSIPWLAVYMFWRDNLRDDGVAEPRS